LKQRETELSTIKAEYEKAKTTPATAPVDNTAIETMRKERDELVEQIRQLDVEKDPIIKQQFDTKLDSLRARAKTYVSPEQQDALDFALRIPEGPLRKARLKDIYDSLESYEAVQLATLVSRLDDVSADREAQVGLMRSKYGELQNWRKENEIKVRKEFEGVFEQQVETMRRDPSMAILQPIPGNDQHNKMVEGVLNAARSQYQGKLPADQLARNAVFSAMTPFIVQHAMNVTKELAEAQEKLKKIESASPGFEESGGKVATEVSDDGPAKGENYQDFLQRSFSKAIQR
jgi:hypothetical protein